MKKLTSVIIFAVNVFIGHAQDSRNIDTTDYNKEARTVQVEAAFPGGPAVWKFFLEKNKFKVGVDSSDGKTAIVSFLVSSEGRVSEVNVENADKIDAGMARKVKSLIANGPKWIPAINYGKNVPYREKKLITW